MNKSIHSNEYRAILTKLREAREAINLTQNEAAKKIHKPQSYISKIERGERRADIVEIKQLADLYGQPLNQLID